MAEYQDGDRFDEAYTYDLYDESYYEGLRAAELKVSHQWRCRWLGEALEPGKGDRIVDLGCGAGLVSKYLAKRGATVHGVDLADEAVAAARKMCEGVEGVEFRRADASDCKHLEGGSFDKACSVDVIEHCGADVMLDMFREAHRLLKDGGMFYVYTPNPLHWIERLKDWGVMKQDETHTGLRCVGPIVEAMEAAGFEVLKEFRPTCPFAPVKWFEWVWKRQPILRQLAIYRVSLLGRKVG